MRRLTESILTWPNRPPKVAPSPPREEPSDAPLAAGCRGRRAASAAHHPGGPKGVCCMKVFDTASIRNVCFIGHGHAGKTSLVSALLYCSKATDKLGSVAEGTAPTDFDPDEIERKVSMALAVASCEHNNTKLNLIDAPGYANYIGDAAGAMRASEGAVLVVHANDGIAVQTEKMWDDAARRALPCFIAITQLDRERAEWDRVLGAVQARFGRPAVPVTLPVGEGPALQGVIDLLRQQLVRPSKGSSEPEFLPIPADLAQVAKDAREHLMEVVAESDDALMNEFLETGALTHEDLVSGLRRAIRTRAVFPVFACGMPLIGAHSLGLALSEHAPAPNERRVITIRDAEGHDHEIKGDSKAPLVAQVFKTYIDAFAGHISLVRVFDGVLTAESNAWNSNRHVAEKMNGLAAPRGKAGEKIGELRAGDIGLVLKLKETQTGDTLTADKAHSGTLPEIQFPRPVIAYAVHSEGKGDDEKIHAALAKVAEEDRTLRLDRDRRTHELMLMGMGYDHVKSALDKAGRRYSIKAQLQKPKVPYLETITKKSASMYRHKKQTGGAGQFAEVHLRIEPMPRGGGFEYASEIFGGSISRGYWPSIEKGIKSMLESGVIAGYPLVDVKAVITDGKEHPVDSKDIAFQVAGREAFKLCVKEAGAVILEPIMSVTVTVPEDLMGDILGDLTRRRGKVQGSEAVTGRSIVKALVPMAEMLEYSATIKSLTSDRGSYTMELDHYEKVPSEIQAKLVAEYKPHEPEDH